MTKCGFLFVFSFLSRLTILIPIYVSSHHQIPESLNSSPKLEDGNAELSWTFSKSRCGRVIPAPSAQFYLFTNSSFSNEGRVMKFMDMKSINDSGYHKNGSWKVLIHGFLQHKDAFFPRFVKDAYLKRMKSHPSQRYNILVVDWGNRNCSSVIDRVNELLSYNAYADCTATVALQTANMLADLLEKKVIESSKDINMVGFSLGAHVAGQTGRYFSDLTGEKIGRITGLDPAGPSSPWWNIFPKHHIDLGQIDADFVDVMHSSNGLGLDRRMGHVDFYLNGGSDQPGCLPEPADLVIKDFLQICSHNFAVDVFAKSILDNSLKGCACGPKNYWNYLKYLVGFCTCMDQAVVGEFINPRVSGGEYFVTTPYEEINWRKYMRSLNNSELARSDSRILSIFEVLCIV